MSGPAAPTLLSNGGFARSRFCQSPEIILTERGRVLTTSDPVRMPRAIPLDVVPLCSTPRVSTRCPNDRRAATFH